MPDIAGEEKRLSRADIKESIQFVQSLGRPVHVISHHKGWAVTKAGACRATQVYARKEDAVQRAQAMVKAGTAAYLVVHKTDGSVETWEGSVLEAAGIIAHSN